MESDWKPGDPIGYLRSEIPEFDLPPYQGERYEATVPDTLDLGERARLALHCLTSVTDPLADYEPYWGTNFRRNPPAMGHNCWQGTTIPKFMWAASLMRLMSGSDENIAVERTWMASALRSQGDDGLIYTPLRGRPWGLAGFQAPGVTVLGDQLTGPFGNGAMLSTFAHFARRDPGPLWQTNLRRLVDGLIDLAVDDGDLAYFWPSCVYATRERPANPQPALHAFESEGTVVPHGLVHAYRQLGYEPALALARKLFTYQRRYFFAPDGTFWSTPGDPMLAHFHAHARGLLALEEYAETTGDREAMDFVLRGYRFAKDTVANVVRPDGGAYDLVRLPGGSLIGYFPEWTGSPEWEQAEICEVTDMVALALRLSEAGVGDYWDDADRWIRNMLAEGQLLRTNWIERYQDQRVRPPGPWETADNVPERNLGGFGSHAAVNDWTGIPGGMDAGIAQCCTANGAKALYWAWERILRYDGRTLRVNLLLNRASPWADLYSCIPYQGRVELKIKLPIDDLAIRIPEWVSPEETQCLVGGMGRIPVWSGRYARIGAAKPGDVATLLFPIGERSDDVHIEKQRFRLLRRGNEVVAVEPPGQYYSLHERPHFRDTTPRWRTVTRFVSAEQIPW